MKKNLRNILIAGLAVVVISAGTVIGFAVSDKEEKIAYSFDTDGGVAIDGVKLKKGEEYDLPTPVKEGYAFEGWYTNENFSGERVTKIVAKESATYYAKWTKLAVITLELDEGALSQTTLYLKPGENVYTFMEAYVPTKDGLVFGAWFNGDKKLSTTLKMPEAGLTLTAKYMVAYTAEIYLQKLDLSGYDPAESIVMYDYVGASVTSAPEFIGFNEVVTADTIASKDALSANASDNVFRHYFDRESYTIMFNPNYPGEGGEKESVTETLLYGSEITVPNDYVYEGYCLIGWSTSMDATEATYNAYYIDSVLHGITENEKRKPDSFMPERNTPLYAVWVKGYEDLFGGNDNIYLFGEEVYLSRGGIFFEGEYNAKNNQVYFGELVGKLYENNTFSYFNDGKVFTLRKGSGLDKDVTITLIDNTVTYTANGEVSQGTFVRGEEEDSFVITYTAGSLAGQEMTIKTRLMSVTDDNGKTSTQAVFNIRNEEEAALGASTEGLFRIAVDKDGGVTAYYPIISFDGFGVATLVSPSMEATYYYTIEDSRLTLSSTEGGSSALEAIITDLNGVTVYVLYDETFDQSFTLPSGDVLTLDGAFNATYTVDGETKTGNYSTAESQFGTIINLWAGSAQYKFLLKSHTEDNAMAGEEAVTTYSIESKPLTYAEYRYVQDGSVYYAPLLVLDETEVGKATLYARKNEKTEYVKVSAGSYQLVDDYYVYTVEEEFEVDDLDQNPFDLTQIQSVVFQVNASATEYSLMYWKSYTTDENVTTDYVVEYTREDGAALILVGGFAILKVPHEPTFVGAYVTKDGLTTIINGSKNRYVELGEDYTFVLLSYAPYKSNLLTENDAVNSAEYIEFDGKGKATYVKVLKAATSEMPAELETKEGQTTLTSELTLSGEKIYQFIANDGSLTFKYINVPETTYIARWNETYNGEYKTEDSILTLDGFGYKANFKTTNAENYEGLYTVTDNNEITFYVEEEELLIYFDLKSGKTFTIRGDEFGSYLFVDNQSIEAYIDLDGYGKASIYTIKEVEGAGVEEYIDENAVYEQNGNVLTIRYTDGNESINIEAKISTLTISGTVYKSITIVKRDAVRTYVNEEDLSILILDDIGNAVKYNKEGVKEEGTYLLITENFLYYANNDLSDACVYVYDTELGVATPVRFDRRAYYTSDLERLLFSEYGYAYFGNTRYYYYEDAKGNVLLYRYAQDGETPNKYGFVEDDSFGSFAGDVKEYAGETYYKSSGFGINLDRLEATKGYYPVQVSNSSETKYALEALTFTPGADEEYISQGSVNLNGQAYDCYVIRERNELGKLELYVSLGYYRFYIDVTYNGTQNTYEVTRLEYVRSLYSYTYLYMYFMNAIFFGTSLENDYGMVHICAEYDVDGATTKQYIVGDFLERSNLVDENGDIISFEEAEYTYNRGVYGAKFTAQDGYTYTLYFGLQYQSAMSRYGYTVAALARHQTIKTADGYDVTVERVVYSELSTISVGDIYTISLQKDGEALKADALFAVDGSIYFVVREREATEDGKILSTKYYQVKLVEEELGDSVDGENKSRVPFYASATVEVEEVNTYYMENGVVYVDVSETRGVTYIAMADGVYIATASEYDEATKTYTVTVIGGATYTVEMLDNGCVDVTFVSAGNAQ